MMKFDILGLILLIAAYVVSTFYLVLIPFMLPLGIYGLSRMGVTKT